MPKIIGYSVVNSLGVRVRDLSKAGDILDQAVTLGVNQGGDIQFVKDDTTALLEEARKKAVENAIAKAKTMASAAGVSLGRVLDMSEQTFQPGPYPIMRAEMAMAKSADAAPVPLATGENAYKVTVNVIIRDQPVAARSIGNDFTHLHSKGRDRRCSGHQIDHRCGLCQMDTR